MVFGFLHHNIQIAQQAVVLAQVRQARPGTIETPEQLRFVLTDAPRLTPLIASRWRALVETR